MQLNAIMKVRRVRCKIAEREAQQLSAGEEAGVGGVAMRDSKSQCTSNTKLLNPCEQPDHWRRCVA